jgi:hypothetical protein
MDSKRSSITFADLFAEFSLQIYSVIDIAKKISEAAMVGAGCVQCLVLRVNESKKTGRVRTAKVH